MDDMTVVLIADVVQNYSVSVRRNIAFGFPLYLKNPETGHFKCLMLALLAMGGCCSINNERCRQQSNSKGLT